MRCTNTICQSSNTKRIEKEVKLIYDSNGQSTIGAKITELWLCHSCGDPFSPAASKVEKWHLPFTKRTRTIPKKWLIEAILQ